MSLYDGLGIDNNKGGKESKPDVSGWSSSYKLLQTQLQAKKASLLQTKRRSGGTTLAPVVDLKRPRDEENPLHFNQQTGKIESMFKLGLGGIGGSVPVGPTPFIGSEAPISLISISSPSSSLLGVSDEYNPRFPNEYEDFVKKRRESKQREREDERKKELGEREKRRKERHRAKGDVDDDPDETEFDKRKRMRDEEDEEEFTPVKRAGPVSGAAIAPPASLMEEDSVPDENESNPFGLNFRPPEEKTPTFGFAGSVASKIMAKYGYKAGQGLGKKEDGMSMALQVEKTSKRGGKIIHERDIPKDQPFVIPDLPKPETTTTNILKNPSKVIILRNMVGPGEVDEDLEPETAEECGKYGKVIKCVIFEIPGGEDEEAVRIFLEFERIESAIKAIVDLNGRYFGGRVVKAGFYNLDKFRRLDLLDPMTMG